MKKKLLPLLGLAFLSLSLGACGQTPADDKPSGGGDDSGEVVTMKYTVAFEVDGQRVKTLKVESGKTITDTVADPVKEGYKFVGWYNGDTLVDLATFIVTKNVTLTAKFEVDEDDVLSVDDVKEAGKTYYLVFGWWETTDLDTDGVTPKRTSYLTKPVVRNIYENFIKYLKVTGASDDDIADVQFRNYSSGKVKEMGDNINADADVDIMIGVGNNINSDAGVKLYNESNDYKFTTPMAKKDDGSDVSRYVACTSVATDRGVEMFRWLRDTPVGKAAFVRELTEEEITASIPAKINLTVTVHGDTNAVTVIDDVDDVVTMPTITVPNDKLFKGFALTADGQVALDVAKNATLKYNDLKDLVAENANTLDLYPILESFSLTVTVHGETNAVTEIDDLDDVIDTSTVAIPADMHLVGYALEEDGDVVLPAENLTAQFKYNDVIEFVAENANTLDLYPIFEDDAPELMVYLHGNISSGEVQLLNARFNAEKKRYAFQLSTAATADAFVTEVGDFVDVIIAEESVISSFTADETGPLADVGAKHFIEGLKVIISNKVGDEHKDVAKELYDFLVAPATEYEFHYTYWHNNNKWVTEAERNKLDGDIETSLLGFFEVTGTKDTLLEKLNVKVTQYTAAKTGVADLGVETNALRDGKGTDLIIGSGANIKTTGKVDYIARRTTTNDFIAADRQIALIHENLLARQIFDVFFATCPIVE